MDERQKTTFKSPERVQQELEKAISNGVDIDHYIASELGNIKHIYEKYGSANEYLRTPYDNICLTNASIALKYQHAMETHVAGDALFTYDE